jgi:predicted HicB family RNase H-like nuclease
MSNLKLILNEELPSDLRKALNKDAKSNNITLNDAAVKALSDHFQIEPSLSGFQYREVSDRFKLRVPEELHQLIRIQAAHRLQTVRGVALSELALHYGTKRIDPGRRPRGEAA